MKPAENKTPPDGEPRAGEAATRCLKGRLLLLIWLGLAATAPAVHAQADPCEGDVVCKESSSPPADDWFRHGLQALVEGEAGIATCALERASELDGNEDGHSVNSFVKSMLGGVKPLPRDCAYSSAPLDRKKYFPRLYLAKAYFERALRSQGDEKRRHCQMGLEALGASRDTASPAKVQQQWERREKMDKALEDSLCCDLLPDEAPCAAKKGGAG